MFDVFYISQPTGLFAHEKQAHSLEHARELSRTRYLWIVDGHNDYSSFDWLWEPSPWQSHQAHVWPSQHQDNGGTWLIPRQGFQDINRSHAVIRRKSGVPVIGIDHGNGITVACDITTRYVANYLGTLRRVLAKTDAPYVWVTSSVCDYTNFDFSWHPSEWQQDMLHVFASEDQKFGDTFYVPVRSFLQRSANLALLEWFDTINFVPDRSVPRRPVPVHVHDHDSQVPAVWEHDFSSPVVQFACHSAVDTAPSMNLWREATKAVIPLTPGASNVLVPREAKNYLKTQLYDYPVIDRAHREQHADAPLDIVFISNGEPNADVNWARLLLSKQGSPNRCVRVDGVTGRAAAYHAAAEISETAWFFAVFAKLEVLDNFDWSWQPDRLQTAKHYIFHALNPVNQLEYGHQAMIAYNRKLTLANPGRGLDFTLDDEHAVVPMLSGVARYNVDAWTAWRTAFREVVKLRASLPDVENEYRMHQWCATGSGAFAEWSSMGAQDALAYYDEVAGDPAELRKSYEWAWLASYAFVRHNLVPDQQ